MRNRVLTEEPLPGGVDSSDKRRVLVADDDRAIRESLARALELEGYDVATAVDGVEALARVRRDGFDALVVDVMMPGVDGLAVCRVLRAEGDRVPVLMLTARIETPDRVAGSTPGPTTTWPNRSSSTSCSPGCGRCCGGRRRPGRTRTNATC